MLTYFLMFGGGWVDPNDSTKLAITQAANAEALSWMKKCADTFGAYIKVLQDSHPLVPTSPGWNDIPARAYTDLLNHSVQGKTDINTALQQFQTIARAAVAKYQ